MFEIRLNMCYNSNSAVLFGENISKGVETENRN